MSKKKRFGISEAMTRGLSETINVVENNAGMYRNIVLPLSRIELDPENPRKLAIDLIDVKHGLKQDDPRYPQKQQELEKLKELAHTIESSGIINPIVVYKRGELYRVVAGERRYLASALIGKHDIEARVFNDKPKAFELKLIQWIENTAREDLTLHERLDNVRELIAEYRKRNNDQEVTASVLKGIIGLSLPQTTYYISALNAPADVQAHIEDGEIRNLDKAALLANIQDASLRREATSACLEGASLKDLKAILQRQKVIKKAHAEARLASKSGRVASKVNLGSTTKSVVVKNIVDSVLQQPALDQYSEVFRSVNWNNLAEASKAFRKLIEILELEMAVQ